MTNTLAPFAPAHLEAAAALLAARQQSDRLQTPELPPRYEDAAVARSMLDDLLGSEGIEGVAAFRDDALVGYLLGAPVLGAPTEPFAGFMHPRSMDIAAGGFAAAAGDRGRLHQRLYAALAERWTARGFVAHYVTCPAAREASEPWLDLGFARFIELGARETAPPQPLSAHARELEFRRAGPGDAAAIQELATELFRSFADPPVFVPFLAETGPARRTYMAELLADPACPHWAAFDRGRLAAMQIFVEPTSPHWHLSSIETPERWVYLYLACTDPVHRGMGVGAALFAQAMAWARDAGYGRCAVHYLTASRAAPFWRGLGFRPISHWLRRSIDERAVWANGRA